jgi:hypothetical protein
VWALLAGLAHAACPGPTRSADVIRFVEAAELAFVDLDDVRLRMERDRAIQAVLCLGEVAHPPHTAALLRLEGVFAVVNGNEAFAVDAFRSALTVQPNAPLKAALAPVGGPLHALYERARATPPLTWTLPPSGRLLFVNGSVGQFAPMGLALLQVVEPDGRLAWTGLVTGPADAPGWIAQPVPMPVPVPMPMPMPNPQPIPVEPLDQPVRTARKLPWFAASGISLALAGASMGGSVVMRGRYEAAPTAARRQATNGLFLTASGAGILGVGLFTVAIAMPGSSAGKPASAPADDEGPFY